MTIEYHYYPRFTNHGTVRKRPITEEQARKFASEERQAYAAKKHLARDKDDLQGIVFATHDANGYKHVRDEMTGEWFAVPIVEWARLNWQMSAHRSRYRTATSSVSFTNSSGEVVPLAVEQPKVTATTAPRRSWMSVYVVGPDDEKKFEAMLTGLRQIIPSLDWDTSWETTE